MDRVHLPPTSWIAPLLLGLATSEVTAQQEPLPATQQEFLERLDALTTSAPHPEPIGDGHSIRGRVVTTAGEPLAGVRVRATTTKDLYGVWDHRAFDPEWFAPPDLARSLRASAAAWLRREAQTREATTGADGSFVLDRLDEGAYDLRAARDGFVFEEHGDAWPRRTVASSDSNVEFTAIPTSHRSFDLRLPDGSAPDRATLEFRRFGDGNDYEQGTWTPANPTVELPDGDWVVTDASGGNASRYRSIQNSKFLSNPVNVVSPPPAGNETVKIVLRGVCAVVGKIVPPANATRAYYDVAVVELEKGKEPDPSLFKDTSDYGRGPRQPRVQLQSDGQRGLTYRIEPLVPGRWYVGVFRQRSEPPLTTAVLDVGPNVLEHDFVLPPQDPGDEMRVRILDPEGRLLRECEFSFVSRRPNGGGGSGGLVSRRMQNGSFAFSRADVRPAFTLLARHPRFGRCKLDVPPDARALELRFHAPVAPRLRLLGLADGVGGRDVAVELTEIDEDDEEDSPLRFQDSAIGGDGTVDVGRLQPATYRFRLLLLPGAKPPRSPWGGNGEREIAVATIALREGAPSIEIPVPKLASLRISCAGAKAKTGFTLASASRPERDSSRTLRYAETDADGLATFEDVPPGAYEIRGPVGATMLVDAPASSVVRFAADTIRVLRVAIRDRDGALARAGLADGDRVVALDGREFEGREALESLRKSLPKEVVTITVERGGERFELVVPREVLDGRANLGGTLLEAPR